MKFKKTCLKARIKNHQWNKKKKQKKLEYICDWKTYHKFISKAF